MYTHKQRFSEKKSHLALIYSHSVSYLFVSLYLTQKMLPMHVHSENAVKPCVLALHMTAAVVVL